MSHTLRLFVYISKLSTLKQPQSKAWEIMKYFILVNYPKIYIYEKCNFDFEHVFRTLVHPRTPYVVVVASFSLGLEDTLRSNGVFQIR